MRTEIIRDLKDFGGSKAPMQNKLMCAGRAEHPVKIADPPKWHSAGKLEQNCAEAAVYQNRNLHVARIVTLKATELE